MTHRVPELSADPRLRAYLIGVALGDGNLSNPNGRAVRLRITCDTKYPALIAKIRGALGFGPRLYRIPQSPQRVSFKYHVRLSRDVPAFVRLVQPLKA